jgi:hypothetical protein
MSPQQQRRAMEDIAYQNLQAQENIASAISAAPVQSDLSPLIALTDQWTGSNLLRGYQRPPTAMQQAGQAMSAHRGVSDSVLNYLRARMQGRQAAQGKPITASATAELSDLRTQMNTIDDIHKQWEDKIYKERGKGASALTPWSPLERLASALSGAIPGTGSSEQEYAQIRDQAAQSIGRSMEGGKLTDPDYIKYLKFLPTPGDTKEQAKNKKENLKKMMKNTYNERLRTFREAGYDVSGFSPMKEAEAREETIPSPGDLKVGDVVYGLTYLGGDPGLETSWSK